MRRKLYIVLIIIIVALSRTVYGQVVSPLEYSKSFDGIATGVIRTIDISHNEIWLGAENGLFGISGPSIHHFDINNSSLKSNYISTIARFDESHHLISAFGDGIYLLNRQYKSLKPLVLHGVDTRSVWDIDVSQKYIVISTIRDLHVIDKDSRRLVVSFSQLSPETISDIRQLKIDGENIWWLDITRGLRRLDLDNRTVSYFTKKSYFPEASYLTAFLVEEDNILIGTDENLYQFNKKSHTVDALIAEPFKWSKDADTTVFKIKRDKNETIWFTADKLYELNTSKRKISTPELLYPLLSTKAAEVILDFAFDKNGNFYAADTQRGLFAISAKAQATQFLGGSLQKSADTIFDVSLGDNSSILFTGEKMLSEYQSSNRLLKEYPFNSTGRHYIINHDTQEISFIDHAGEIFFFDKSTGITTSTDRLKSRYKNKILVKDVVSPDKSVSFILLNNGKNDEVLRWEGNDITLVFEGNLEKIEAKDRNTVFVSALYDGIYRLETKNTSISAEKLTTLPYSDLTCLYLDSKNRLWMCGDGHGLTFLDKNYELKKVQSFPFQYIRGVTEIDNDRYLVATNSGLFVYDLAVSRYSAIGRSFGINDEDFEYDALQSDKNFIVVIGDNYSYLLDKHKVIVGLAEYEKESSEVIFTELKTFDNSKNEIIEASDRLLKRKGNAVTLSYNEKLFELQLAVSDFINGSDALIEYRLLGDTESWHEAGRAEAKVSFSSLEHGNYELQARVKSNYRESTISSLTIIVAPPWWLSVYAYVAYFTLFLLLAGYGIRWGRAHLKERNEELVGKVGEQKQELEQNQTYIRSILKRKHRVLMNVAKEVQTPLTLILGPLQLIQDNPDDKENFRRISVIARNARRLHLLINQITEMERLESAKSLARQYYPLKEHFPVLIANMEPEIQRKGIRVITRFKATGSIPLIPDSLEKIVYHLMRNAIAASDEDTEVIIETRCEALHLVIQVRDSGIALSETDAANIFERFSQLDTDSGTDWLPGLAIVKEAALANSGWIGIESKPNRGNCLSVYLPLINLSEEAVSTPPVVIDVIPRIPRIEGERSIVLVVEDNADMRQYLVDTLKLSYNCIEASDGKQALKTMQVIVPDLIVSDDNMPVCDGFALRTAMLQDDRLKHIPFIIINNGHCDNAVKQCVALNIEGVLEKPVEAETLRYTAYQLLSLLSRSKNTVLNEPEELPFDLPVFANTKEQSFYTGFMQILAQHFHDETFSKCDAASLMAVSERQLSRKLQMIFGMNFSEILKRYRIFKAKKLLDEGNQVTQVAYDVGFSTLSYFSRSFKLQCKETPSQYQDRAADVVTS